MKPETAFILVSMLLVAGSFALGFAMGTVNGRVSPKTDPDVCWFVTVPPDPYTSPTAATSGQLTQFKICQAVK